MRARRTCATLLAFICVSATLVPAAAADPASPSQPSPENSKRANELFQKGRAALRAGNYAEAHRLNSEAWSLRQSPDIAANLAQSEIALNRYADAAHHFAFALRNLLPSSSAEQKAVLEQGLAEAKSHVGAVELKIDPAGARVRLNGNEIGKAPLEGDVYVAPGRHRVEAELDGYAKSEREFEAKPGEAQKIALQLAKTAESTSDPPFAATNPAAPTAGVPIDNPPAVGDSSQPSLLPAIIAGGVGIVGIGAGVFFAVKAGSTESDRDDVLKTANAGGGCGAGTPLRDTCSELGDLNEQVDRERNISTASFIVGGAAAAFSVGYLIWRAGRGPSSERGRVEALPLASLQRGGPDVRLVVRASF